MHGFGLSGASARSPGAVDAFVTRLGNLSDRIHLLNDWSHEVVRRNLTDTGLDQPSVPLPEYLGAVADVDRAERFATMLEWMTDHARRKPLPGEPAEE